MAIGKGPAKDSSEWCGFRLCAQNLEDRGQRLKGVFLANVTKNSCELSYTPSSQDTLSHGGFSIIFTTEEIKRNEMMMALHLHHLHRLWDLSRDGGSITSAKYKACLAFCTRAIHLVKPSEGKAR